MCMCVWVHTRPHIDSFRLLLFCALERFHEVAFSGSHSRFSQKPFREVPTTSKVELLHLWRDWEKFSFIRSALFCLPSFLFFICRAVTIWRELMSHRPFMKFPSGCLQVAGSYLRKTHWKNQQIIEPRRPNCLFPLGSRDNSSMTCEIPSLLICCTFL